MQIFTSNREPLQVDELVDYEAVGWTSLSLRLLYLMLNLCLVKLRDLLVQSLDDVFGDFVGAERDTELVLGAIDHVNKRLLNIIVNLVHTEVQVFDLRVFDCHPLLDFLASFIDPLDRLDVVDLRHRVLWLLLRLQLLVLLNNCVTCFHFLQVILYLVGGEREATYQVEKRNDHARRQVQLAEAEVLDASVSIKYLRQGLERLGAQVRIAADVEHFNCLVVLQRSTHGH